MENWTKEMKIEFLKEKGYIIQEVEHLQYVNWNTMYRDNKIQAPPAWDEYTVTHALKEDQKPDINKTELSIIFAKEYNDEIKKENVSSI